MFAYISSIVGSVSLPEMAESIVTSMPWGAVVFLLVVLVFSVFWEKLIEEMGEAMDRQKLR